MCSHLGTRKMEYSEELGTWLYDGKPSPLWESEQREKLVRPLTPADLGGSMEWVEKTRRFLTEMGIGYKETMGLGYSRDRTRHEPIYVIIVESGIVADSCERVTGYSGFYGEFSFNPWTGEFMKIGFWE